MEVLIAFLASLAVTVVAILVLRPVARWVGLLDRPDSRKRHTGAVPLVGGVAIFVGALGAFGYAAASMQGALHVAAASGLIVAVGMLDDRFRLSPEVRVGLQVLALILVVAGTRRTVGDLGDLLGIGMIRLGRVDVLFTIIAAIALINAFNMLDGLDGLAGAVSAVALSGLSICFFEAGDRVALTLSASMVGAVSGFLVFNAPSSLNRRLLCFLGDSGSTFIGFVLVCLCLIAIRSDGPDVPPVVVLWLLPLPILELFTTTFRRAMRGVSPLTADRGHMHYRLLDAGLSIRGIVLLYAGVSVISAAVGLSAWHAGVSDAVLFSGLLGLSAIWFVGLRYASGVVRMVPRCLRCESSAGTARL